MQKLFSYCIPVDDGAAPNPFHGICSLVICKPKIRSTAEPGDWIVATGSQKLGLENKVVYAMKVTGKIAMKEYDNYCKNQLKGKIPNWRTNNYIDKVGDCIYDFSEPNNPKLRTPSVHKPDNIKTDLGGKYALLSNHFYYFGDRANDFELPEYLLPIVNQRQGHKSDLNAQYFEDFVTWISQFEENKLYGEPYYKDWFKSNVRAEESSFICSKVRMESAKEEIDNY